MSSVASIHMSARLMILDPDHRLLLFRHEIEREPPFCATPGGPVLIGETVDQAAARELTAKTGFDAAIGPRVRKHSTVSNDAGISFTLWAEHYFVVRVGGGAPSRDGWTAEDRRTIQEVRWWSAAELRVARVMVRPDWIPDVLDSLASESTSSDAAF